MPTPMTIAAAMPTAPPSTAQPRPPPDAWVAASRKTAVSKPSLSTARNAIRASASEPPVLIACCASRSSSPLNREALRFIQMIMVVTKTTAIAPMTVSSISCCLWGRFSDNRFKATPTAMLMPTARATPTNMGRTDLPLRFRKAATMLTMRVASRPSRKPIRKVPTKMPCTVSPIDLCGGLPILCFG